MGDRGCAHSIARPWIPISCPFTQMTLTVFELFSWLQKRFRPSDPDMMANTALDATASSSCKNWILLWIYCRCQFVWCYFFPRDAFTCQFGRRQKNGSKRARPNAETWGVSLPQLISTTVTFAISETPFCIYFRWLFRWNLQCDAFINNFGLHGTSSICLFCKQGLSLLAPHSHVWSISYRFLVI